MTHVIVPQINAPCIAIKIAPPYVEYVQTKNCAPTGNRTRAFHVTGGDTNHYTIEACCKVLFVHNMLRLFALTKRKQCMHVCHCYSGP